MLTSLLTQAYALHSNKCPRILDLPLLSHIYNRSFLRSANVVSVAAKCKLYAGHESNLDFVLCSSHRIAILPQVAPATFVHEDDPRW